MSPRGSRLDTYLPPRAVSYHRIHCLEYLTNDVLVSPGVLMGANSICDEVKLLSDGHGADYHCEGQGAEVR